MSVRVSYKHSKKLISNYALLFSAFFMFFVEGRVGADDCPNFCDSQFEPVCGSDGRTYLNKCRLQTAACREGNNNELVELHKGRCSDVTKMKNIDEHVLIGVSIDSNTMNKNEDDCSFMCLNTMHLPTVCGSDGKTYSNICLLKKASCKDSNIKMAKEGECENGSGETDIKTCTRPCPRIRKPVCGSDGNTYSNICLLKKASCKVSYIKMAKEGECENESGKTGIKTCIRPCPQILRPICGSDGKTYGNACDLEQAACTDPSIKQVREGGCKENLPGNQQLIECWRGFPLVPLRACSLQTLFLNPNFLSHGEILFGPFMRKSYPNFDSKNIFNRF